MSLTVDLKSIIKELTPMDVFDYYDGPKFYSCRSKTQQIFLIYWIDTADNYDSWLYLRMSQPRYTALKQGELAVATVLSRPEDGFAFIVNTYQNDFEVKAIANTEINSAWLPPSHYYLKPVPLVTDNATHEFNYLNAIGF